MPESVEVSSPLFRFYHGRSMRHTFQGGDCIHFIKVEAGVLKRGDVIVFASAAGGGEDVIHRIVKVDSSSFLTRGDNNSRDDVEPVSFSSVLGKAVFFERAGVRKSVTGGFSGMLRARVLNRDGFCRLSVRFFYSCLRRSGIVRLFWKPKIETIRVSTDAPSIVRLVHKGKIIGKLCTDKDLFVLHKPYDLVIKLSDLSSLLPH